MSKLRTFIAVETSPEVRSHTGRMIERLRRAGATVKWVDTSNIHLTLKFLGDVAADEIPGVCQAVTDAVSDLGAFEVQCRGAGAFPDTSRPRTVWIGVEEGEQQMVALHEAVDVALERPGFRRERRRFHPHLTIGRLRHGGGSMRELGRLIDEHSGFEAGRMRVEQAVVFSSELTREGPIYTVLSRAGLGD